MISDVMNDMEMTMHSAALGIDKCIFSCSSSQAKERFVSKQQDLELYPVERGSRHYKLISMRRIQTQSTSFKVHSPVPEPNITSQPYLARCSRVELVPIGSSGTRCLRASQSERFAQC